MHIQPPGVVLTSSWLFKKGYSAELLRTYRNSHWLKSIGNGAMIRQSDEVDYTGAIYTLQQQLNLSAHPAAKTAMALMGKSHYLGLGSNVVYLFGNAGERLPSWFKNHDWGVEIRYIASGILPAGKGMVEKEHRNFFVKISSPARAIMECLYLAPHKQDLTECFEMMESLNNLNPVSVQELLEHCTSVKVKRLFLYMAEKAGHVWFKHINISHIDLGSGKRSLVSDGIFVAAYNMTVPKELEADEKESKVDSQVKKSIVNSP
ncbi:MAG: hypothetical protein FD170_3596 [Bacteroidetes bacterium]|nr:MAG: hypothetical protein FD170_3596 [Bacteroidota bacterium]